MPQIKEVIVDNWNDFDQKIRSKPHRQWVYRGQSNKSWNLESSLYRAFEDSKHLHNSCNRHEINPSRYEHESAMMDKFKANAHLYLNTLPNDKDTNSWLSTMQHYGAPTRLLDFTFSPYVAAYFALESGTDDACIYALQHEDLRAVDVNRIGHKIGRSTAYEQILNNNDENGEIEPFIYVFEPRFSNERIIAQQGLFLMPSSLDLSHEEILAQYENIEVIKFIVPKELRLAGLEYLTKVNMTSHSIYPGFDGFCKSLKNQILFDSGFQRQLDENF